MLQRLEARRQQGLEAEAAAVERQMEEARENIRKAEVGPPGRELGVASRSVTPMVRDVGTGRGGGWDAALGAWCWGCHHAWGWGRWGWDTTRDILGTVTMCGVPR